MKAVESEIPKDKCSIQKNVSCYYEIHNKLSRYLNIKM